MTNPWITKYLGKKKEIGVLSQTSASCPEEGAASMYKY